MNEIAITVVVAGYNSGKTLDKCIDSLVFQTIENIEIILVDACSTDETGSIMRRWQERFPGKIKVLSSPVCEMYYAKNMGIKEASGKYVVLVKPEDYIDYRMLNRDFLFLQENAYPEILFSPVWRVKEKKKKKYGVLTKTEDRTDYLSSVDYSMSGKIIRKDIFLRYGMLPEVEVDEEEMWMFPVVTKVDTIGYCPVVGYYNCSQDSFCLGNTSWNTIQNIVLGSEHIISNSADEYKEYAYIYVVSRLLSYSERNPIYKDVFYKHAYGYMENLKLITALKEKSSLVGNFVDKYGEGMEYIPQIVYVNGFTNTNNVNEYCEKVFRDIAEIIILNDENCNISGSPDVIKAAYEKGDMDFVGKYFAIKACYDNGGVYIDDSIEIDAPFNLLINDPAFFGYESDDKFSDKVFGSCAGNLVLKKILKTYEIELLYEDKYEPLSSRIRTVLVGMGNVALESRYSDMSKYGFCVYPVEMFVWCLPWNEGISVCHYKSESLSNEDRILAPIMSIKATIDEYIRKSQIVIDDGELRKDLAWVQNQRHLLQARVEKMTGDIEWLQKQKNNMLHNVEWLQKQKNNMLHNVEWLQNQNEVYKRKNNELKEELEKYKRSTILRFAMKFYRVFHRMSKK